jgi:hypothetical protein
MSWSAPQNIAQDYYNFVKQCPFNEELFANFKSIPAYHNVVGMSWDWQAFRFYDKVKEDEDILSKLDIFKENDRIGNPPFMMNIYGHRISPNTLRHVQTLVDLKKNFGSLDGKVISELGVGYGATAFMVSRYYKPADYYLIDLPDVQVLAQRYLNELGVASKITPPPEKVDLFISEFCLSEFDDAGIYDFYDKYVIKADNVYIMSNLFDEERKQRLINRMNEDYNLTVYPETHGTTYPSYVIVGKKEV